MDTTSYRSIFANSATVNKKWILVDAEGKTLGRFASQVAAILRGKNKAEFTPHTDCGDNVVIVNAEKVRLTGKKWNEKIYQRFSGYPGGLSERTATEVLAKDGRRLLEIAIKGMLPHTKLGREMFRNLYVYTGTEHPHGGQNPEKVELKY